MTYIFYGIVLLLLVALLYSFIVILRQRKKISILELRAKKNDEIKSNFLTHITQALHTPVNVINEYCHSIETKGCENLTDAERVEVLNNIQRNNLLMLTYLNELQELTSFDGAVPTLSMIKVNIVELIMSYRREILPEVQRGVTVSIHTDMSPHSKATLDTTMFRQLIMHLLRLQANRTKEGSIVIEYASENKGLRFNLHDKGTPVAKEVIEKLFTDNVKGEDITHPDQPSTIISLNICKSIINAMEGTIEARQGENGKGITISFWIPCHVRFN